MNLIIDIGNTSSKYYCFDGDEILAHDSEEGHALSFLSHIQVCEVEAAMVCTVVDLPSSVENQLEALPCPVYRFSSETPIPIKNRYRTPETLGTDRLAAAVGAWSQAGNRSLLIIDAGSCITFDVINADGEYIGGNIAPGLHARLRAIGDYFPRLPHVTANGEAPALGYDTETAIRAGVIQGMRHEIEGYIMYLKKQYDGLAVFMTGGDDHMFANAAGSDLVVDHFLVPKGLNHILRYNTEQTNNTI